MRISFNKAWFDEFDELAYEKENKEVKEQLNKMKSPYLQKIEQAKKNFQSLKKKFECAKEPQSQAWLQEGIKFASNRQSQKSNQTTQRPFNEPHRIITETSNDQWNYQEKKEPFFRQWNLEPHQNHLFNKKGEIYDKFSKVFEKKMKVSQYSTKGQSFKIEEKQIIENIYKQIGDLSEKTVDFQAIIHFFEKCPLFYHIYNIHPNSLGNVLNDSAHRYETKLTQQEFMNLFLLNNRTNLDYENYNIEKITKKCILDEQSWKELKEVFIIFDTFGNETIQLKQFIQKLKISLPLKHLLEKQVLYFPSIDRSYKLKKIIFDIQHKLKIIQDFVRWEDIRKLISNFNHIKEPTIDVIDRKYLASGKITYNSNTYMLKDQVLTFIKQVYNRSPKYCDYFIKVANFCDEIFDSTESKHFLKEIVRNNPCQVTFGQAIGRLKGYEYQYLDLDEIIQWFSLRDVSKEAEKAAQDYLAELEQTDSDDEFNKKLRQQYKKKKNIHNLPTKYLPKSDCKQTTKVEEFNLTKRTKTTIREQKVKEMIKEKEEKQRKQCEKKFKANSIPASINHEKYLEYKEKLNKNKEHILSKLNTVNEKDIFVLKYLEANTRLFEKPKKPQQEEVVQHVFQPKPIPWFAQVNLLESIEQDKKQRINELKKQSKQKYLRQWKNLPGFLQQMNLESQIALNKNGSEKEILLQLQNHKNQQKISAREVPNFKELHEKFQEQLQRKKQHFKPTVIKQFNLTSPKQCKSINEALSKEVLRSPVSKASPMADSKNFIGSTLKFQAMVKLNQEKKVLQQKKKHEEQLSKKQRKKNQKLFAKYMRKELIKEFKLMSNSSITKSQKIAIESNHKKEIAEIYKRVFTRPFLFQSKSPNKNLNSRLEAKAKAVNLNESSSKRIYEIVSDLDSQRRESCAKTGDKPTSEVKLKSYS